MSQMKVKIKPKILLLQKSLDILFIYLLYLNLSACCLLLQVLTIIQIKKNSMLC